MIFRCLKLYGRDANPRVGCPARAAKCDLSDLTVHGSALVWSHLTSQVNTSTGDATPEEYPTALPGLSTMRSAPIPLTIGVVCTNSATAGSAGQTDRLPTDETMSLCKALQGLESDTLNWEKKPLVHRPCCSHFRPLQYLFTAHTRPNKSKWPPVRQPCGGLARPTSLLAKALQQRCAAVMVQQRRAAVVLQQR